MASNEPRLIESEENKIIRPKPKKVSNKRLIKVKVIYKI